MAPPPSPARRRGRHPPGRGNGPGIVTRPAEGAVVTRPTEGMPPPSSPARPGPRRRHPPGRGRAVVTRPAGGPAVVSFPAEGAAIVTRLAGAAPSLPARPRAPPSLPGPAEGAPSSPARPREWPRPSSPAQPRGPPRRPGPRTGRRPPEEDREDPRRRLRSRPRLAPRPAHLLAASSARSSSARSSSGRRPGPLSRASSEHCCTVTATVMARRPDLRSGCSVACAVRKMACRGPSPRPSQLAPMASSCHPGVFSRSFCPAPVISRERCSSITLDGCPSTFFVLVRRPENKCRTLLEPGGGPERGQITDEQAAVAGLHHACSP